MFPQSQNESHRYLLVIIAIAIALFFLWYFLHCSFCRVYKDEDRSKETWKTYQNEEYGFEFKYPDNLTENVYGNGSYFTKSPQISVLQIDILDNKDSQSISEISQQYINVNNCPDDHVIRNNDAGILYVLYCSASTENYVYITRLKSDKLLKLTYSDNFEDSWTESEKIELFDRIISTFKFIK